MSKINQATLVITVSELLRDSEEPGDLFDAEAKAQLEAIIQELMGKPVLVEIEQA